ncbi:M15 family metallopeptidase [Actinokineospora sp. HUAS TT18]|uniref:M15 family metallopeptidase n=1 Tax=Actinokineospora sp. HUAS TT18 TaxID=3447451 RepID=UPI003F522D41
MQAACLAGAVLQRVRRSCAAITASGQRSGCTSRPAARSPRPTSPRTWRAAVDLTLCTDAGEELDMGTKVNASPEESDLARYTAAPNISAKASANRRLLADALPAVGMVNYPTEWWHWSYGDRYWATASGAAAARYGPAGW